MKAILSIVLSFFFGAVLGQFAGFDPIQSGVTIPAVGLVANAFGLMPAGVVSTTIDLTSLNAQLNTFIKTSLPAIWSAVRQGLELDVYATNVPNVMGKHASVSSIQTDILQGFQTAWTPKGGISFEPLINESFHIKADYGIDNIDVLFGTYLEFLATDQTLRSQWPFVKWLVMNEIVPKMVEELNSASGTGNYTAPTPGTAGSVATMMNGVLTIVSDLITATTIAPIVTGAITSADATTKVETFVKAIAPKYRPTGQKQIIMTSNYVVECYKEHYRSQWGLRDSAAANKASLDQYNVELVGFDCFGSSSRMIMTPKKNFLKLFGKVGVPNNLETQLDKRVVNLLGDWWIGYGFATPELLFVNDQA